MALQLYDAQEFAHPAVSIPVQGTYLRRAKIIQVDHNLGTVDVEFLDFSGIRKRIPLPASAHGMFDCPVVGAAVLLAFDQIYGAYIVGYIRYGYSEIVGYTKPKTDTGKKPVIIQPYPGDLLLSSYIRNEKDTDPPVPTGSSIHLQNTGDIEIRDAFTQSWRLSSSALDPAIRQNSMSYHCHTEAGILDFGLVKRQVPMYPPSTAIGLWPLNKLARPVKNSITGGLDEALNEFRLRVWETSDNNIDTLPEDKNPLVELTLGTKVKESGANSYVLDRSAFNEEITVQLKTNAGHGFALTIDKQGNLSVNIGANSLVTIAGNSAIKIAGDSNIAVSGNAVVNVEGDSTLSTSGKSTISASEIVIKDSGGKGVIMEDFISLFNNHTHPVPVAPGTSSTPLAPITSSVVTKNIKVR